MKRATAGALALLVLAAGAARADAGAELAATLRDAIARRAPWLEPAEVARGQQALDALPLRFEPNRGQAERSARFVARSGGGMVFVRERDVGVALPDRLVKLRWLGSAARPAIAGEGEQEARTHYFTGGEARHAVRDVPGYDRVRASALYPGIDLVLYGQRRDLELDFALLPGADPAAIRFAVEGADRVALDGAALALAIGPATLRIAAPVAYQEIDGERRNVPARYVLASDGSVRFELGAYDARRALVIDPVLGYSTYLGGSAFDLIHAVAVDTDGRLVVAGRTASPDFPLASPLYGTKGAGYTAFVAKLKAGGNGLVWSTFLGGARSLAGYDQMGVSLDATGNVVVTGETNDPSFPVANPWQATLGGGYDAFVTKLTPNGDALVFSTYLGGSGDEYGRGVAFDPEGYVEVTGVTTSSDLPLRNPTQFTRNGGSDAFVARYQPDGGLVFSTYLGGGGTEWGYEVAGTKLGETIVVGYTDSADFPTTTGAYRTTPAGGSDVFVTRFVPDGTSRVYSTLIGGSADEEALGLALDLGDDAYVVGWTRSADFPTLHAFQAMPLGQEDGFVSKLAADGSALVWSTRLGGNGVDFAQAVAVDLDGYVTVGGVTTSTDFPTAQPVQATNRGFEDGFLTKLAPSGDALAFSTYLGGSQQEHPYSTGIGVAVDRNGQLYLGGTTASVNYPLSTSVPIFQSTLHGGLDGVVTKVTLGPEVLVRLRPSTTGASGRFRIANGLASNRAVELRFWIETPSFPAATGVLVLTNPITLPANLAPFDISFTLPSIPFPGSVVGLRLLDPVTGDVIAESLCGTLPCN